MTAILSRLWRGARWGFYSGVIASAGLMALMATMNSFVHGATEPLAVLSYGLHMQLLTLADRLSGNAEDRHSRPENPACYVNSHRNLFLGVAALVVMTQLVLLILRPWLILAIIASGLACAAYFLPLPGIGVRIKEIRGAKAIFVPTLMVVTMLLFHPSLPPATLTTVDVCVAVAILCHVNLMLYDIKDISADRAAGIRSLASTMRLASFLRLEASLAGAGMALSCTLPRSVSAGLVAAFVVLIGAAWWLRAHVFDIKVCVAIDGLLALVLWGALTLA